jgi:hypothetical protein
MFGIHFSEISRISRCLLLGDSAISGLKDCDRVRLTGIDRPKADLTRRRSPSGELRD